MGKKPNILLLFTDQQRYDTINAGGNPVIKTPNLSRLVREGCLYNRAYSPNPVCIPARHNLITGLPAKYHGFAANSKKPFKALLPTLPQILSNNGYDTRAIGKMHFRPVRNHNGFNRMELMEGIPKFREDDEYATFLKEVGQGHVQYIHGIRNIAYMLPQQSLMDERYHGTKWVADRTIEYIRSNKGRRPFFLWSSWIAPHPPFNVVKEYANMYRDADIKEPLETITEPMPHALRSQGFFNCPEYKRKDMIKRIRQLYYSQISHVDFHIGRILNALDEIGELENTFIIFASDHGEMIGDYGCFSKKVPYEESVRIPLIMRYPTRIKENTVSDALVSLNDILPTVLDVTGIDYTGEYILSGGSVLSAPIQRQEQYIEHEQGAKRWISVVTKKFKYNYYYSGGCEELYDLESTEKEGLNLLESHQEKQVEEIRLQLREKLLKLEEQWGLEGCIENGDFKKYPPITIPCQQNKQFPIFPINLPEEESPMMNSITYELMEGIRNEPLVNIDEIKHPLWNEKYNW